MGKFLKHFGKLKTEQRKFTQNFEKIKYRKIEKTLEKLEEN